MGEIYHSNIQKEMEIKQSKKVPLGMNEEKAREKLHRLESLIPFRGFVFLTSTIKYKVDSPIKRNVPFKTKALLLQIVYILGTLLAFSKLLDLIKLFK